MPPAISVRHLSKTYRVHKKDPGLWGSLKSFVRRETFDVRAVDGVSFQIETGELVGFLGPNGAGKTTTLKVLSGLLYPTEGEVSVLGFRPWRRQRAFQRQFSLVMGQKNQLWWDLPALDSFLLNREIYEVPRAQFDETLEELTAALDLGPLLRVQVRKLSLGERMKCELAAALLHRPAVLFLDEPTIGLDVVMQKKIREFILDYNRRRRATILLTSHYMEDVEALCERVIIIDHGKVIYDGKLEEIVRRHVDRKTLAVTFLEPVSREALEGIGEVLEFESQKATVCVPRAEASGRAARLLNEFPVADLNIEEPPVDDVIRHIFTAGKE
ncbi:MAG: ABC transporter [Candidatus Handelsmanbacteria bacterium RIFCSPLOWO2_12_FULL_64_10]|uniref:ABC transporter n=1 Tax=Handelsmanbacteria sp. (strain RIFCSPLOWO2_12_FULL_64_10) TaxID=1817868 RepID=A0A1F6CB12_HANXR|nr:MAG: ABC transporter [Candidatus Handelsmanbacteria bacterium RIFCSPLOWO2_12_FULL_64_10]